MYVSTDLTWNYFSDLLNRNKWSMERVVGTQSWPYLSYIEMDSGCTGQSFFLNSYLHPCLHLNRTVMTVLSSHASGVALGKHVFLSVCRLWATILWNIIVTIATKFTTDIYGAQRMNPTDFGDLLTFLVVIPWSWHLWFLCEMSQHLSTPRMNRHDFSPSPFHYVNILTCPILYTTTLQWRSWHTW